jgi:GntR family transcriptional regulator
MHTQEEEIPRLHRQSITPLYYQLKEILREQIKANAMKDRDMLPSENQLVETYGVSRHVARRALAELANEGLIISRKGVGSFVNVKRLTKQLSILGSFTQSLEAVSNNTYTKVLRQDQIVPEGYILEALELSPGSEAVFIQRAGFVDSEPIVVTNAYYPREIGNSLLKQDLTGLSLYRLLAQNHQIEPYRADWIIYVIPASAEQAAMLDIREGFPLMCNRGTTFNMDNKPFEYSELCYRSDRVEFAITGFRRNSVDNSIILVNM